MSKIEFWGVGTPTLRREQEQQTNKLYKQILENQMAKTKQKRNWKVKAVKGKIVATHAAETLGSLSMKMAQMSPTIWTDKPQEPGLHLMQTVRGDYTDYQVVRAVLTNDGLKECYLIKAPSTDQDHTFNMSDWTQPSFQKVKE